MRRLWAVVVLLTLAACEPITGLDGARRISGEPFRADFMRTADCVGISEDSASYLFSRTRWHHAPALPGDTAGLWVETYEIYLRDGEDASDVIRNHEALHLILQTGGHVLPAFGKPDRNDGCEIPPL